MLNPTFWLVIFMLSFILQFKKKLSLPSSVTLFIKYCAIQSPHICVISHLFFVNDFWFYYLCSDKRQTGHGLNFFFLIFNTCGLICGLHKTFYIPLKIICILHVFDINISRCLLGTLDNLTVPMHVIRVCMTFLLMRAGPLED